MYLLHNRTKLVFLFFSRILTLLAVAPPSPDRSPAGHLPYMQPELQVRVIAKPTTSPHQAEQGLQERRL